MPSLLRKRFLNTLFAKKRDGNFEIKKTIGIRTNISTENNIFLTIYPATANSVRPAIIINAVITPTLEVLPAVYQLITQGRQSCGNYRLYRTSVGIYLALWSFCYAVSCASQSVPIRLLTYIWIGCSTVLNAWLYRRRITVLKRKKILPSVFPLIDLLAAFSGIFPLLPIMFSSDLSTYTILNTIYFLVVGSGFSLQIFNFAEYLYFKRYQKFDEAMKLVQLYKDSKNDLCV